NPYTLSLHDALPISYQLVERHLDDQLTRLPKDGLKSRALLEQMRDDEIEHANHALQAGVVAFPRPIKGVMKLMSRVMTSATYRIGSARRAAAVGCASVR